MIFAEILRLGNFFLKHLENDFKSSVLRFTLEIEKWELRNLQLILHIQFTRKKENLYIKLYSKIE